MVRPDFHQSGARVANRESLEFLCKTDANYVLAFGISMFPMLPGRHAKMVRSILIVDDNPIIRKVLCGCSNAKRIPMFVGRRKPDSTQSRGLRVATRLDRLRPFDARNEWPRCGPRAETLDARGGATLLARRILGRFKV